MATEAFTFEDAASATRAVEFRLPDSGYVLDLNDDTFKASGHTTASLSLTEVALESGRALYTADFDTDRLALSASQRSVVWRVVDGSGNGISEFATLEFDEYGSPLGGAGPVEIVIVPNFEGDLGDDLEVTVAATRGGRPYALSSTNNVRIEVREHSASAATLVIQSTDFAATGASAYNDGQYEATATTPSLVANTIYSVSATVAIDGTDVESKTHFRT